MLDPHNNPKRAEQILFSLPIWGHWGKVYVFVCLVIHHLLDMSYVLNTLTGIEMWKQKRLPPAQSLTLLRFVTSFPHPHVSLSPFSGCLVYALELCVPGVGLEDGGKGRRRGGQGEQEGGKRRGRMGMKMCNSRKQWVALGHSLIFPFPVLISYFQPHLPRFVSWNATVFYAALETTLPPHFLGRIWLIGAPLWCVPLWMCLVESESGKPNSTFVDSCTSSRYQLDTLMQDLEPGNEVNASMLPLFLLANKI